MPWLKELIGTWATKCRVCNTVMVWHKYGEPLTCCPFCFPEEAMHPRRG